MRRRALLKLAGATATISVAWLILNFIAIHPWIAAITVILIGLVTCSIRITNQYERSVTGGVFTRAAVLSI